MHMLDSPRASASALDLVHFPSSPEPVKYSFYRHEPAFRCGQRNNPVRYNKLARPRDDSTGSRCQASVSSSFMPPCCSMGAGASSRASPVRDTPDLRGRDRIPPRPLQIGAHQQFTQRQFTDRLRTGANAKFAFGLFDIIVRGGRGEFEDRADLRVGLAARHPAHRLQFTPSCMAASILLPYRALPRWCAACASASSSARSVALSVTAPPENETNPR